MVSRAGFEPATPGLKVRFGPCLAVISGPARYRNVRSSCCLPYSPLRQMLGDGTPSATVRTPLAHHAGLPECVALQGSHRHGNPTAHCMAVSQHRAGEWHTSTRLDAVSGPLVGSSLCRCVSQMGSITESSLCAHPVRKIASSPHDLGPLKRSLPESRTR